MGRWQHLAVKGYPVHTYLVTLWNPEDGEAYLAADGRTTTC
jgi:hypothetical protein